MERFAVKSQYFSLLKAFKEEAEKLGWVYDEVFNAFSEDNLKSNDCLYFHLRWKSKSINAKMSLSNNDGAIEYRLPKYWDEALEAIKINKNVEVSIQEIANWMGVPVDLIKIKQ